MSKTFFDRARRSLFNGKMSRSQVAGINSLLRAFDRHGVTNRRQRAYMLATAYWESARTMRAIKEFGHGSGKAYGRPDPVTGHAYYGRGLVQLTHKANYRAMGARLGIDLVRHPDKALDLRTASDILVLGMRDGMFDRKNNRPLRHYLGAMKADWWQARRTVNILDHSGDIATVAQKFDAALSGDIMLVEDAADEIMYPGRGLIPALVVFGVAAVFILAKITGVL